MQFFNFLVDIKNSFGSFVLTLDKEAQQGKLILSFDVLGLEIAFLWKTKRQCLQIKIRCMLLSFFFQFFVFR